MKNLKTTISSVLVISFLLIFGACKNGTANKNTDTTTPTGTTDTTQSKSGVVSVEDASGCLAGNEFRAEGKIAYKGRPPIQSEILLLTSIDAKPIIIAKDLAFNADGTFRIKTALPAGIKRENVHNIMLAFKHDLGGSSPVEGSISGGRMSIFSGWECEGDAYSPPLINHDIFDKPSSGVPSIEIACDDNGNMTWGKDKKIKDFDDFRRQMTAELKRLQKEGIKELPDCSTSGGCNVKVFTVFSEVKEAVLKTSGNTTSTSDKKVKKTKPTTKAKPAPAPQVTQYENGTLKLNGKTVTLENLRKELQAALLKYKVIPNKVSRVSVGTVGMGMRHEVETIINESIAGAKWVRKKAALAAQNGVTFAQKPERIDFAKAGSNSLVWEQKVKANGSKDFVFYAKKGQKLLLNLIDDTKQGTMDLGKATIIEPDSEGSYETTIEVTKDYIFSVSNNSNKMTSFRISISLEDPKKAAPAKKPRAKK